MQQKLGLGLLLVLVFTLRGEELLWRHTIECLGDAEKAELVKPGAEGSAAAMALHYKEGPWSRFNWPLFRPVLDNSSLRLQLRREGPHPEAALLRLLTRDGNEWALKKNIALTEQWQAVELRADDFRFYRGAGSAPTPTPRFDDVIQCQVLPMANRDGDGILLVDSLAFLPHGPSYSHDEDEWRSPPEPVAMEFARLQDLRGRYRLELAQLDASREHVLAWIQELRAIVALWAHDRAAAQSRLTAVTAPWKRRPLINPAAPLPLGAVAPELATEEAFRESLSALAGRRPDLVNDFRSDARVSNHVLYQAPAQAAPERREENGELFVRQQVVFSAVKAPQTVFLGMDIPPAEDGGRHLDVSGRHLDVSGRVLVMKLRCTARLLHEQRPFLLRLCAEHPEGLEAFSDLRPEPMPGKDWVECRFDVSRPFRGTRFDPKKVTRLELRVENVPGEADDFLLDCGAIYLGYPPPLATQREDFLAAWRQELLRARMALLTARNELLAVEDALHESPALRDLYLSSFNQLLNAALANEAAVADVLPPQGLAPLAAYHFRTRTEIVAGQPELVLCLSRAAARLSAELRTLDASAVVAAREWRGGIDAWQELRLPFQAPLWSPGNPQLVQLRLAAYDAAGALIAADSREVGLREAAVFASGLSPLLRQNLVRRRPDWFFRYNGQATFPRTAAFSWMRESMQACPAETAALLADLWVDGGRFYGLQLNEALWSSFERGGYAQLAAYAPSYKALQSWEDMKRFKDQLSFTVERMTLPSSHASPFVLQVGNEVELDSWGANINAAFPGTPFQPLDLMAETLRRERLDSAPIMYVRAGHFNTVVPLPHEDICGINQYTGRYGGRLDEVHRDLAELAAEAALFNRPMMITEWNGPKYSWASAGIGGVSIRGAAYYLDHYWRAMVETPGVVGSAEFTLNWVIAPFEDLTNQSREDAWRNRPQHASFGGGRTADHVPLVPADKVVADECYRSMQAFHGPLYVMARTPGGLQVLAANGAEELSAALAPLRSLGKELAVDARYLPTPTAADLPRDRHCLVVLPLGSGEAALPPAWSGLLTPLAAGAPEPLIRTLVHPYAPDRLLCVLQAQDEAALARAIARLGQSASALLELRLKESQMRRAVALIDRNRDLVFQRYVLDQAGRGFFFSGDDTRTALRPEDFYDNDGQLLPAWSSLAALYLDTRRALTADEWTLVQRLQADGATLVLSAGCYLANPCLRAAYPAELAPAGDFGQPLSLDKGLQGPLPLRALGGADLAVLSRFAPSALEEAGIGVCSIGASGASALAWNEQRQPVIVRWPASAAGAGAAVLLGYQLGDIAQLHWRVTHYGLTHSIYDRDTACGLERASFAAINAGLLQAPDTQEPLPALRLQLLPQSFLVAPGAAAQLQIRALDDEGRPVADAQINARARVRQDGRNGASSDYVRLSTDAAGNAVLTCVSENADSAAFAPPASACLSYRLSGAAVQVSRVLSVQLKAWAPGYVPADAACAFVLAE
jgi:hypothetical protein